MTTTTIITHVFGDRARATRTPDPEPSPLGAAFLRWLDGDNMQGEGIEARDKMLDFIRSEFLTLNAHAEALAEAIEAEANRSCQLAATTSGQMEGPASPSEQYAAGYRAGMYQAACNTQHALQRVLGDTLQKAQDA